MENRKTLLAILVLVALIILLSFVGSFAPISSQDKVSAQTTTEVPLYGWAWSSNIGWVAFGDPLLLDADKCGGKCNPVWHKEADGSGEVTGWVWANPFYEGDRDDPSDDTNNIGWINLNPTDDFPEAPEQGMEIDSNGAATGWIRAIGAADGWDGWIKLSGSWSNGVRVDNESHGLVGYAWGGDVVGWLKFGAAFDEDLAHECDSRREVCFDDDGGGGRPLSLTTPRPVSGEECVELEGGTATVTWESSVTGGKKPYDWTWSWTDDDGDAQTQNLDLAEPGLQTRVVTYTLPGLKSMTAKVIDDGVGALMDSDQKTGTVTIGNCPDEPTPEGGDGGSLTLDPTTPKIYIRYQASGQTADTIVSSTKPQAIIINNSGTGSVSNITVDSVKSQKSPNPNLNGLTEGAKTVRIGCSLVLEGQSDNFQPCNQVNVSSLAPNGKLLFRLRVEQPLKVISDNNPYTVTVKGQGTQTDPLSGVVSSYDTSVSIPFDYLVSTFTPQ